MTTARQQPKQYRAFLAATAAIALVVLVPLPEAPAAPTAGAVTERVVVNWHTGLAIDGYDPVAYFTDGKPLPGSAEFELSYGGAIWRFRNTGNRAAFADRPDVYMPQFGGYDPLGVAHGIAVAGNSMLWYISGERLFLFYDRARLRTFIADPQRAIAAAERKWPDVLHTLNP